MSSATEEKMIRSIDFAGDQREPALTQAEFYTGLIDDYIRQKFQVKPGYSVEHAKDSPGNHRYRIRRGSGELTVETNFGMNTAYGPGGPRNFYTLNLEATHRNLALDATVESNDNLVWCLRVIGGIIIGLPMAAAGAKAGGAAIFICLGAGASIGGFFGNLVGRAWYRLRERQLNREGEIDEIADEWGLLSQTLEMIMIENEGFSYTRRRGANVYE
jgi:hypothetical protein